MASIDTTAPTVATAAASSPQRTPLERDGTPGRLSPPLVRRLTWLRNLWSGASRQPGRDRLTRVVAPGERQEPR